MPAPHPLIAFALTALCATAVTPCAFAATAGDYVDAVSYFSTDAQFEAWFTTHRTLERNFDEICGDTFCEGDYSNIRSLRYTCSVERATGRIGMCAWTFAASDDAIDPATGRITSRQASWQCRSPLGPAATIGQLLEALQGDRPLYAILPGSQSTLMDGLVDCL